MTVEIYIGLAIASWLTFGMSAAIFHLALGRTRGYPVGMKEVAMLVALSLCGPFYYIGLVRWMCAEVWKN